MTFTCNKCGWSQAIHPLNSVDLDPEETHRIWGVACAGCGFYGKSQVNASTWQQLQDRQVNPANPFDFPALLGSLKRLVSSFRLPSLSLFKQE